MSDSDVVIAYYRAASTGDAAAVSKTVDAGLVVHGYNPKVGTGPKDVAAFFQQLMRRFPDGTFTVDKIVMQDDLVSDWTTFTTTKVGADFDQIAIAGPVTFSAGSISRVANGVIVERWVTSGTWM